MSIARQLIVLVFSFIGVIALANIQMGNPLFLGALLLFCGLMIGNQLGRL